MRRPERANYGQDAWKYVIANWEREAALLAEPPPQAESPLVALARAWTDAMVANDRIAVRYQSAKKRSTRRRLEAAIQKEDEARRAYIAAGGVLPVPGVRRRVQPRRKDAPRTRSLETASNSSLRANCHIFDLREVDALAPTGPDSEKGA